MRNNDVMEKLNEILDELRKLREGQKNPFEPSYPHPSYDPKQPWVPLDTPSTPPQMNRCKECGLDLSGSMGYVCNRTNCPTYPPTTC